MSSKFGHDFECFTKNQGFVFHFHWWSNLEAFSSFAVVSIASGRCDGR